MPDGLGLGEAAGGLTAGVAFVDILPRFKAFAAEATAEVQKAAGGIEAEASSAFAGVGKAATFAVVGAAVAIGAASIEMADKFEAQHARLETALHNVGDSFDAEKTRVDATDKAMERLGFTNADVEGNLSSLVLVTHSASKAQSDMALAADVARGRHIDLSSATQLLVKVESGHVALLGRLGINTKDATGATISQEEAIKRLTALYGGNASAYTNTFAGKMQVLKATSEDLGKNIGLHLIPVIETLASDTLHVVTFFEDHRAAAIALGIVVGGPLVAAMGAYVVAETQVLARNIAGFFSSVADVAAGAIAPLLGLDGALASVGMTEDGVAASSAAAAAGIEAVDAATAIAATAGVAALVGGFILYNRWLDEADKKQNTWAQHEVASFVKSGDANKAYADERNRLQAQIDEIVRRHGGQISSDGAKERGELASLNDAWKKHQAEVTKAAKDAAADQHAAAAAITGDLNGQSQAATAAGKAYAKALADVSAAVGPDLAKIDQDAGYTTDQLKAISQQSDATAKAMTSSFDSATSVVDKFGSDAQVNFKDVNKYMHDQIVAAQNWATNLKTLAKDGIDGGLLQQLAEAGPKSAALVSALLADVKAGNLAQINQDQADLRTILGSTIDTVNSYDNSFFAAGTNSAASWIAGYDSTLSHADLNAANYVGGHTYVDSHGRTVTSHAYAAGGFIEYPQFAHLGEGGRRELVLPLEDHARRDQLLAQAGLLNRTTAHAAALAPASSGAAGPTFIAQGVIGNEQAVVRWMRDAFTRHFGGSSKANRPVWASGTATR